MLRAPLLRTATWILASSALFALGCGDDTSETTATTTGQGGEGSGGDDAKASSGTPASSVSNSASSGDTTPQSSSSGGDGGSGAGDPGPGPSAGGNGGGTGGSGDLCGNGNLDDGEECDGGPNCNDECHIVLEPGCGNGQIDDGLEEECDDGNDVDFDGCDADCTITPAEVECATLTPGACTVDAGSDAKVLIGDILLPNTILKGGQVSVDEDGIITCVGCNCEAEEPGATVVTCPSSVVSPGLINTHEHITYSQNNPHVDNTGERYEHRHQWRSGIQNHTKIPASSASQGAPRTAAVRWGELRFLLSGATSLIGSGEGDGFLRNLDKEGQEGLGVPPSHYEVFPLHDNSDDVMLTDGCDYPSIDSEASIESDLSYLPHVSEGINAAARNEFVCVSSSDDDGEDLVQHQSSFIHGVGLNPADYAQMARDGTSLIWSPRSNIVLYGNTAQVTTAARAGVNISLGTDWIISGSMNMFRELRCASELNDTYFDGFFTRRDLWRMVTDNAARTLSLENVIGVLSVGNVADIAIYDASDLEGYAAVVDADVEATQLVLRAGEPLYGDTAILDDLPDTPAGCEEPFDSCMADKTICVQSEVGSSYATLRGAAGQAYGPFFCGDPTNEPSCVPTRPQAVNGSTVYSGDPDGSDNDGDGIDNGGDNCPDVFNPIRPMDDGEQGDADGDGVGDACDPCPLVANVDTCVGIDAADEDGDGIPTLTDNCPYDDNPAQIDTDGDEKGDVCDQCPNQPNPGFFGVCAATIYDIKTGDISGSVTLTDVLVTACVDDSGFFVQHKVGDDQYDGPQNSGIYVFSPDIQCGTDLDVGDRLDLAAETNIYFLQVQLQFAEFTTVGQDSAPEPVVLTVAQASGTTPNAYEGVLARVEDVEVSDNDPAPGPGDSNDPGEFVVDNALRIDNFVFTGLPSPANGTQYSAITGVLAFKNQNQKMEPRDAGDLDP